MGSFATADDRHIGSRAPPTRQVLRAAKSQAAPAQRNQGVLTESSDSRTSSAIVAAAPDARPPGWPFGSEVSLPPPCGDLPGLDPSTRGPSVPVRSGEPGAPRSAVVTGIGRDQDQLHGHAPQRAAVGIKLCSLARLSPVLRCGRWQRQVLGGHRRHQADREHRQHHDDYGDGRVRSRCPPPGLLRRGVPSDPQACHGRPTSAESTRWRHLRREMDPGQRRCA